jgi:hypothetical protein
MNAVSAYVREWAAKTGLAAGRKRIFEPVVTVHGIISPTDTAYFDALVQIVEEIGHGRDAVAGRDIPTVGERMDDNGHARSIDSVSKGSNVVLHRMDATR